MTFPNHKQSSHQRKYNTNITVPYNTKTFSDECNVNISKDVFYSFLFSIYLFLFTYIAGILILNSTS